jgi:hypothetical protein
MSQGAESNEENTDEVQGSIWSLGDFATGKRKEAGDFATGKRKEGGPKFKDPKYKVPKVQRPYEWPASFACKMLETLWDQQNRPCCWFNTIYLLEAGNDFHIYDGQQRFTTLQIIALALEMIRRSQKKAWEEQPTPEKTLKTFLLSTDSDRLTPRLAWVSDDENNADCWDSLVNGVMS